MSHALSLTIRRVLGTLVIQRLNRDMLDRFETSVESKARGLDESERSNRDQIRCDEDNYTV
jgi:hypothetical protein